MKRGELAVKLERWEPLAPCAACFLLTAVLCGAQLFGGYAPFALGLVAAAGSGKRGLAALLGGVAGALVFLDFSHALRTLAVAVLLYTANNAFCETRWYRSRRFLPAMTALMYLAVELVYLLQAGADRAALCLLSIALAVLAAVCARAVLEGKTMNEEQRQAAALFETRLPGIGEEEVQKLLRDVLCSVKRNSIDRLSANMTDAAALGKLMKARKDLAALQRIPLVLMMPGSET